MQRLLIVIIILFSNFWIWKIFSLNLIIFVLLVFQTFLLWFVTSHKFQKKAWIILVGIFAALLIFQYQTTKIGSLIKLDNDEQRIHDIRIGLYNSKVHFIRLLFYRLNLRDFFEGDLSRMSFRVQRNFFETIDPNVYFFAGHPRERVWANDFQKFPFILIIPFFIGVFNFITRKNYLVFILTFISVLLLSFIGHINELGPFILIPFFVLFITEGLEELLMHLKKYVQK